jgi:streptogramin lyase
MATRKLKPWFPTPIQPGSSPTGLRLLGRVIGTDAAQAGRRSKLLVSVAAATLLTPAIALAGIVEVPIPTPSAIPLGITTGPDGNLWFTEAGGNKIGRITPAGIITEFTIPTPNSSPFGITLGPDQNLWFTEANGNKIGRITPAGVITEFPIPTANSAPNGITPAQMATCGSRRLSGIRSVGSRRRAPSTNFSCPLR